MKMVKKHKQREKPNSRRRCCERERERERETLIPILIFENFFESIRTLMKLLLLYLMTAAPFYNSLYN